MGKKTSTKSTEVEENDSTCVTNGSSFYGRQFTCMLEDRLANLAWVQVPGVFLQPKLVLLTIPVCTFGDVFLQ
jgi:hypothetical protein